MSPFKRKTYYCIRVGDQYLSGTMTLGACTPRLVTNRNLAYVYDTLEEAEAAARYIQVSNVTWTPVIVAL